MKRTNPGNPVEGCRLLGAVSAVALSAALYCAPAQTGTIEIVPKFSVDPASPAIFDHGVTPDDVLVSGPSVYIEGRDLGLADDFQSGAYDDLDALSFGQDPITPAPERNQVYFSVDRVAVGLEDIGDVHREALPGAEEASGDVFRSLPPLDSNTQFIDEEELGLQPGFFGDDLDALELDTEPDPWIYFSVDFFSLRNAQGLGDIAADILVSRGQSDIATYATYDMLGLDPEDDLDALALWDEGLDATLNPGDHALFSLDSFSPTVISGAANPGDILYTTFNRSFSVWATAAALGLTDDDELNALDTVPVPATLALLLPGLVWLRLRARGHRL